MHFTSCKCPHASFLILVRTAAASRHDKAYGPEPPRLNTHGPEYPDGISKSCPRTGTSNVKKPNGKIKRKSRTANQDVYYRFGALTPVLLPANGTEVILVKRKAATA